MQRQLLLIVWPSFLGAGLLAMLVFSAAHPDDMKGFGGALMELSPSGVYTLAFLAFWAVCALSSALTLALTGPAPDIPPAGQGRYG